MCFKLKEEGKKASCSMLGSPAMVRKKNISHSINYRLESATLIMRVLLSAKLMR